MAIEVAVTRTVDEPLKGGAMQACYEILVDRANSETEQANITPFEFFAMRADGRQEHRSYLHRDNGVDMVVAKVLVRR